MAKERQQARPLAFVALVVSWLVPGAGHVYIGRPWRGAVIFVTIAALFWSGMAIGGVMTMDYENERWWFVADMFTGVHGLVGWYRYHQAAMAYARKPGIGPELPTETPAGAIRQEMLEARMVADNVALVAPGETVARTYAGVAGLLNLMCIFDAVVLSLVGARGEPQQEPKPEHAS